MDCHTVNLFCLARKLTSSGGQSCCSYFELSTKSRDCHLDVRVCSASRNAAFPSSSDDNHCQTRCIRLSRAPRCRSFRSMLVQQFRQDLVISVNKNSWIGRCAVFISAENGVFKLLTESVYIKLLPYSRCSSLIPRQWWCKIDVCSNKSERPTSMISGSSWPLSDREIITSSSPPASWVGAATQWTQPKSASKLLNFKADASVGQSRRMFMSSTMTTEPVKHMTRSNNDVDSR